MDGIVVLLKPPGMTSSNAVYDARRIFSEKRAGHLGTLDPAAAGVLPVCFGRATRLFDLLVDKDKEYLFEIAFGIKTDTQDAQGSELARDDRAVSEDELRAVLPRLTGEQAQTASVYSALKVGGRKMYDLARAGEAVEPKTRRVTIHSLELMRRTGENRFLLKTVCSRGTYVRSLCESIAAELGTVAYMPFLLRARSGPFMLKQSVTISELEEAKSGGALAGMLVSCEEALAFLPEARLEADRLTPTKNGLDTYVPGLPDGPLRVYAGGMFLGLGFAASGRLKLKVHLY
jgi:tRNA pseudouridine55 synthase